MSSVADTPGIHRQVMPGSGGRYTIAIPEDHNEEDPCPLIVVLHWGGPVTPFYGESILIGLVEPALRELGAVMVAPDCNAGQWANAQSERELLELYEFLQGTYGTDRARTLIAGYSLGGLGTWYMAARHPDRFAAALPMAARPPEDLSKLDWRTPLYIINSRQDEVFPLAPTEEAVSHLQEAGASVKLVILDDVTHFETGRYYRPLRAAMPWIIANL